MKKTKDENLFHDAIAKNYEKAKKAKCPTNVPLSRSTNGTIIYIQRDEAFERTSENLISMKYSK